MLFILVFFFVFSSLFFFFSFYSKLVQQSTVTILPTVDKCDQKFFVRSGVIQVGSPENFVEINYTIFSRIVFAIIKSKSVCIFLLFTRNYSTCDKCKTIFIIVRNLLAYCSFYHHTINFVLSLEFHSDEILKILNFTYMYSGRKSNK